MNRLMSLSVCMLLTTLAASVFAQTGTITGKVYDEQSGEELVGANILLVGTTLGATADINGTYRVTNVPPGTYSIRISFVGYVTKNVTDIFVKSAETLVLNVNLASSAVQTDEVTVTAERIISSEAAVLAERKKAAAIGDGISQEQIKRTPDATAADALRRVTGLSIVDNKFVFIRGITDRYNSTTLDGASVTSTESGKKGFSFDLLPSNLLDNTVVIKSATPDLPGDFAGGLVQMNTLDFPTQQTIKFSVSSSYNSNTTSKQILTSQGGGKDWLGFDDGTRDLPAVYTSNQNLVTQLPNTWAPVQKRAPFNGSFSFSIGDNIALGDEAGNDQDRLGYVAALTYSNKFQTTEVEIDEQTSGGSVLRKITGAQHAYSVLWGGVVNVSYKLSDLHRFSFKNNYNHSGEDNVARTAGLDGNIGSEVIFTSTRWSQRSSYTGLLTGEHSVPGLLGLKLVWRGGISTSNRTDPDRKLIPYTRPIGSEASDPFTVTTSDRSWEKLNDRSRSAGIDLTLPLDGLRLKAGALVEWRNTDYFIKAFRVEGLGADFSLFSLPIERVYAQENFGPRGFRFVENPSNAASNYEADAEMRAGYLMADVPFTVSTIRFRIVAGGRWENSTQNMYTTIAAGDPTPQKVQLQKIDLLPSANLTAALTENVNVRLAYSQTVNRPEFRELASVAYFDFQRLETVYGNPSLQRALIRNYDVRLEIFPEVGEVFAVSYFNKHISNPIEEVYQNSSTPVRTWFNSERATNTGWELEVRKSLGFIGEYWKNVVITGNYTRIQSNVKVPPQQGVTELETSRPLQGQSPYVINFSLTFTEPILGTSFSMFYSKFGRRLDAVGGQNEPDVYEEPRDLIDLSVTQPLWYGIEAKLTAKNVLGKDQVLTKRDTFFRNNSTGTTFGLSLSLAL